MDEARVDEPVGIKQLLHVVSEVDFGCLPRLVVQVVEEGLVEDHDLQQVLVVPPWVAWSA